MQKILIILAAILSISAIGLGYLNRSNLLKEKSLTATALADRDNAAKKAEAEAAELKAVQEKLSSFNENTQKTESQFADLQARLDKANANLTDLQSQLARKDSDLTQGKQDLAAKDARIAELEAKSNTTAQPSSAQDDVKKQLQEKDILNGSLQAKLKDAEAQLMDLRQREAQRKSKVMRSGLEGRILAVNSSWNFVVISLGDRNGVINNAELLIKRGSQLVGKVRVTSVEPSTSIADIVVNSVRSGLSVQPGDTVIYNGPESDSDAKL